MSKEDVFNYSDTPEPPPAKLTLSQKRLWLINKIEVLDIVKRNIRVQIREHSGKDCRAKDRAFRDWKRRADDKVAWTTQDRAYYRNLLGQVNRDLKAADKQLNTLSRGSESALAMRFMEIAKAHLIEAQYHLILQLAEGSLRDQDLVTD